MDTLPRLAQVLGIAGAALAFSLLIALLLLARRYSVAVAERDDARLRADQLATELRGRQGLHAMCSHCKGIRSRDGRWIRLEDYLEHHLKAEVTHGVCPECMRVEYPGLFEDFDPDGG